jgi:hypothetical protein
MAALRSCRLRATRCRLQSTTTMSFLDRRAGGAALALIMALGGCIDVDGIVYDLGEGGAGLGGWGVGGAIPEGGGGSGRSYFDVVMDDAPAGFWRFNEASSAEVLDSSGNDHHALSVLGDGTIERDVVGALFSNDPDAAIALSGGAYVILSPNPFDLSGLAPYTFEAWVDVAEATNPPPPLPVDRGDPARQLGDADLPLGGLGLPQAVRRRRGVRRDLRVADRALRRLPPPRDHVRRRQRAHLHRRRPRHRPRIPPTSCSPFRPSARR